MHSFIEKLAAWHRLHEQRDEARLRLTQAEASRSGDLVAQARAELSRVEQAFDEAFAQLVAAANDRMARQQSGSCG